MSERANWTDQDWATYLDCEPSRIPEIRKLVNDNYHAALSKNQNGQYYLVVFKRNTAPSGFVRVIPSFSLKLIGKSPEMAIYLANTFIDVLQFSDLQANTLKIPPKAFQLMSYLQASPKTPS